MGELVKLIQPNISAVSVPCLMGFSQRSYAWLVKCYKNTFLYSIFFYLKSYIYLYSMKKNIFVMYEFCHSKKIYLYSIKIYLYLKVFISIRVFLYKNMFIQSKINAFNEIFLFNDFRLSNLVFHFVSEMA